MLIAYLLLYIGSVYISGVSMKACDDHFHKENFFEAGDDLYLRCNGTNMGFPTFKTTQIKSFALQVQYHGQSYVYKWIKATQVGRTKFNVTKIAPRGSDWKVKTSVKSKAELYSPDDFDVHFTVKNASPKDSGMYTCYLKADYRRRPNVEWEEFHGISRPVHYSLQGEPRFPTEDNC